MSNTSDKNNHNFDDNDSADYLLENSIESLESNDNGGDISNKPFSESLSSSRNPSRNSSTVNESEPEIINIKSDRTYKTHVGFKTISPTVSSDDLSYFQTDTMSRSTLPRKFYNDICIPLEKISSSKNINDFYQIDYDKFQQFCDKPSKVKSIAFKNSRLDKLRRRKLFKEGSAYFKDTSNNSKPSKLTKGNPVNNTTINIHSSFQDTKRVDIPPERITFFLKENSKTNHIKHIKNFQQLKRINGVPISEVMKNNFFWIDIIKPTKEEIAVLSDVFGIHPLTVEDMELEDTREKMETFVNYYYLSISTSEENEFNELDPVNVAVLVYKDFVFSFHNKPVQHTENIIRRIIQLTTYDFEVDSDWMAYAHIDDISDSFIPYLNNVEEEVNEVDELVIVSKHSDKNDMIRRIGKARKHVTTLLRLISNKTDMLKSLINRINTLSPQSNNLLYLNDVQDHVLSMVQDLKHYEEILITAHSNYLAQISIETTLATNDTNDIANKLSVLGTIFLPLSLISGIWGMNVVVPGQESDTLLPFIIVCLCMFAITIITMYFSKRVGMV